MIPLDPCELLPRGSNSGRITGYRSASMIALGQHRMCEIAPLGYGQFAIGYIVGHIVGNAVIERPFPTGNVA